MSSSVDELLRDAASPEDPARRTRAVARLMTILEREPHRLAEFISRQSAGEWPVPQFVLGITGAPGTGKSSLTDAIVQTMRARDPDRRLGVIAVDPSSPFTGGAVLGDRVRMMRHATDPGVFIRSLATRGHLGGLSLGVRGVLRLMGLLGCDTVLLETVGVGQSEVEVAGVADLVLLVLAPGHGDSVQLLKAGLLEVADLYVINKSDLEGANQLHRALVSALGLVGYRPGAGRVLMTSITRNTGLEELVDRLEEAVRQHGAPWSEARAAAVVRDVEDAVLEQALQRVRSAGVEDAASIVRGERTVEQIVDEVLSRAREIGPKTP